MAGSVLSISKGQMLQAADAVLANPPAGTTLAQWYQQLRQELVGQATLASLAAEHGAIAGQADIDHVQHEALGSGGGAFWPQIAGKEAVLREGFIQAYDVALSTQPTRPIVTFWLVVDQPNVFEVVVAASPSQVTLYWVTSSPAGWGACTGRVQEDMWLIAPRQRVDQVRARFGRRNELVVRDAGADETPPRQAGGLAIMRLRGD